MPVRTDPEEEGEDPETEKKSTPTPDTTTETIDGSFECTSLIQSRRGRRNLIRNRKPNSPGANNLRMPVEYMKEEHLQQALETDDPNRITIADNNGKINNNNAKRILRQLKC